jgi:hypothetical protein
VRAIAGALEKFAGPIQIASDNETAVTMTNAILKGSLVNTAMLAHSDLSSRVVQATKNRVHAVSVRWIRSHQFELGHRDQDAVANHGADALARRGAEIHEVQQEVVDHILARDKLMQDILATQAKIQQEVLRRRSAATRGPPTRRVRRRRRPRRVGGDQPHAQVQAPEPQPDERGQTEPDERGQADEPPRDGAVLCEAAGEGGQQDDPVVQPLRVPRRRGPAVRRPPGLGILAGPRDHLLEWLADRIVCIKCGKAVNRKLRSRMAGVCKGSPRGPRERRNLALLEPPPQAEHGPSQHQVLITDSGRLACKQCGRCLQPRLASRLATFPCGDPTSALTRAWVRRLAGMPSVSWNRVADAGNVGRGIVARVQDAINSMAVAPAVPRRRITGKRPAPT